MNINIDNIAEKSFDNFKKITPALIAISILSASILFLPRHILAKMSLDKLPKVWIRSIGLVFLFSVALIATIIISSLISSILNTRKNKRIKENLKRKLKILSPRQKEILFDLLHSRDMKIELDSNSGDTLYLVENLFLHLPQQVVSVGWDNRMYAVYTPQPWLMDLYNEEPELFG